MRRLEQQRTTVAPPAAGSAAATGLRLTVTIFRGRSGPFRPVSAGGSGPRPASCAGYYRRPATSAPLDVDERPFGIPSRVAVLVSV
ncbi:hypothetical protein EVAR_69500_1 [Eumeta japonica]|uniref:Uncharacterized protein n=1 Tax=Eumeta variegata TaxID=151549 RepID=A0A4C2ACA7_EUMVA|nr:hypothetical protein EVAR_69500_1 [Eumeta japonica]